MDRMAFLRLLNIFKEEMVSLNFYLEVLKHTFDSNRAGISWGMFPYTYMYYSLSKKCIIYKINNVFMKSTTRFMELELQYGGANIMHYNNNLILIM